MSKKRIRHVAALLLALAAILPTTAAGAPSANLWERWLAHDPAARTTIDHAVWGDFLSAHLVIGADGINRVNYRGVSTQRRSELTAYLDELQRVAIDRYARPEQFAFWVNLYNALTVRVVLDHYPVASIRDIDLGGGFFADGPWQRKLVTVEANELSLDDIEHRILRPIWNDPRVHYAVSCASLGCPNLQPRAFTGENREAMLESAARAYVNHPRGIEFVGGRLVVSSIYEWFQEDFGGSDTSVIAHLTRYADAPLAEQLRRTRRIGGNRYDWSLNDAAKAH